MTRLFKDVRRQTANDAGCLVWQENREENKKQKKNEKMYLPNSLVCKQTFQYFFLVCPLAVRISLLHLTAVIIYKIFTFTDPGPHKQDSELLARLLRDFSLYQCSVDINWKAGQPIFVLNLYSFCISLHGELVESVFAIAISFLIAKKELQRKCLQG